MSRSSWTPIAERLPEQRIRVLTKDELGMVRILYWGRGNYGPEGEEITWRSEHTDLPWENLDHTVRLRPTDWMALPDARSAGSEILDDPNVPQRTQPTPEEIDDFRIEVELELFAEQLRKSHKSIPKDIGQRLDKRLSATEP